MVTNFFVPIQAKPCS